jgi:hypothetical protein
MAKIKRIRNTHWKTRVKRPKPIQRTSMKKTKDIKGPKESTFRRKGSDIEVGVFVKFAYLKPWAWDTRPVVFLLHADKQCDKPFIEGINIRYMNKKYWLTLENFKERFPKADGRLFYFLLKRSAPRLLKAYRRYLYERMGSTVETLILKGNRSKIRTRHTRKGELI